MPTSSHPPATTLSTPRLTLQPLTSAHAEAMFELLRDPALYEHLDDLPPASVDRLRERYTRLETRQSPDGQQDWLNWIVCPLRQTPIGFVQATLTTPPTQPTRRTAWVAYLLARNAWGRGHAAEATQAMIEHLVHEWGVVRCLATVEAANERSIRLLARLGFQPADAPTMNQHTTTPTERLYVLDAKP